MAEKPLTDAESEALRLRAGHPSIRAAAKAAGMDESVLRRQLNRAEAKGFAEPGAKYEVPSGQVVRGVSALVDAEGRVKQQWVKTKAGLSPVDVVGAIREALESDRLLEKPPISAPVSTDDDLATVYICADFHIGLLSWGAETGHNWDLKLAQEAIGKAAARLVSSSPGSDKGVVLGLGDLLHSDGYDNMTSRSKHVLDVDGRYPKSLKAATLLMASVINLALQKHDTVLVRILPGNHDDQSAIAVSLALAMYYSENPRVTVDDDPSYFWWWSWGTTFLGATHGDRAKMRDLPLVMATRNPEAWGRSKFRHVYTGHVHHQSAIEMAGVTVESFQTPAAPDSWHHQMGYGANRSLTSITLHKEYGEIARNKVNLVAA